MAIKNKTLDLFGIDTDVLEKSKDITETFELGKLEVGSQAFIQFLEDEPRKIKVTGKFGKDKGKEIEVSATVVYVDKIIQPDGTEVPISEKQTLWLTSETLNLGVARIYNDNESLKGHKAKIKVTMAFFKNIGAENRCYRVSSL